MIEIRGAGTLSHPVILKIVPSRFLSDKSEDEEVEKLKNFLFSSLSASEFVKLSEKMKD